MSNFGSTTADIAVQLAALAVKGTATAIFNKIKSVKNIKDNEKLRNIYDEIINELLSERDEAVRIAQVYKSELDRIVINDEDIKHLHTTISNLIDIMKETSSSASIDAFNQIKSLISIDTLKVMQLLGFNYKAAIGEPLTSICADAIHSWGNKKTQLAGNKAQRHRR